MRQNERLRKRIEAVLALRSMRLRERVREHKAIMADSFERSRQIRGAADYVFRDIVRDRVRLLQEYLKGAQFEVLQDELSCRAMVGNTANLPATITLTVGVRIREGEGDLSIYREQEVAPDLHELGESGELTQPFNNVDLDEVTHFVEAAVVRVVETCRGIEQDPEYRRGTEVVDPVCGMRISYLDAAENVWHNGHRYYFCVPTCAESFRAEPEKFAGAYQRARMEGSAGDPSPRHRL
jgi:YHS domain-containing protein